MHSSAYHPPKRSRPRSRHVWEEAPFACGGDPRNLWQPRRPRATSGVWRADEETEGAFDGWNHLEMVEKRPRRRVILQFVPPSPKRKSETHFLEGKVVPPFWTADAPPPPPPHGCGDHTDEKAHPWGVRGVRAEALFGGSHRRGRRFGSHGGGVG